jgi:membrane protease YdiL (CAAX protease family)
MEHSAMAETIRQPVELYRAGRLPEAYALRSLLEAEGIAVRIENESLDDAIGILPLDWSTLPRVIVDASDESASRRILARYREERTSDPSTENEDELRCLTCGTPMAERDRCPACGWSYIESEGAAPVVTANREPDAAPLQVGLPTSPPSIDEAIPTATVQEPMLMWREVLAVLAVGVLPQLASAMAYVVHPTPPMPFWSDAIHLIAISACTIVATLFIMKQGGMAPNRVGLSWPRLDDLALAPILLIAAVISWRFTTALPLPPADPEKHFFTPPVGVFEWLFAVVKYLVAAYAEELVTRVYLISRLRELLGSRFQAVAIAAVCFASYHAYQGPLGFVNSLFIGLTFGIWYCAHRRIWPLVLGHAGTNLLHDYLAAN